MIPTAQRSLTGALQVQLKVTSELRRSPRKLASSACLKAATTAPTPLEGLAKHLHDASASHSESVGSSWALGVLLVTLVNVSNDSYGKVLQLNFSTLYTGKGDGSSLSSRPIVTPPHVTPKVSGLSFTPDLNGPNSKVHKNNKVLQEVRYKNEMRG